MLVEQRTYTTLPGKVNAYLKLYEAEGLAVQLRILGRMVGYYRSEIGALNQIVHMRAYESLDERAARRAALLEDEEFKTYVAKMLPLLSSQESRILRPAPFFTLQWQTAIQEDRT